MCMFWVLLVLQKGLAVTQHTGSYIARAYTTGWIVCLLLFYIPATAEVISGRVPTCDSAYSWQLYSAPTLGDQVTRTLTWYPTQSHYPDTKPTSSCTILLVLMPSTWLGSDKYKFFKSLIWLDQGSNPRSPGSTNWATMPSRGGKVEEMVNT